MRKGEIESETQSQEERETEIQTSKKNVDRCRQRHTTVCRQIAGQTEELR